MRIFLATLLLAASALAGVEDDVKKAEMDFGAGITKNDFALLGKVLADDLHYLHSTGLVENKAGYLESLRSGRQKYNKFQYGNIKVRVYGAAAVVNADAHVEFVTAGKPGKAHLAFTHVFAKKGAQWQLVSHQSLKVPE